MELTRGKEGNRFFNTIERVLKQSKFPMRKVYLAILKAGLSESQFCKEGLWLKKKFSCKVNCPQRCKTQVKDKLAQSSLQ